MKTIIQTTLFVLFTISFSYGQNQTYTTGTNTYTFNNTGTFQLTGIPNGTTVQVECYAGGGGGGGIWTKHYASTSSGGGGGGGYAKLNTFSVSGGSLKIIVGKGGLKGKGSISTESATDGKDGKFSAVYSPGISDTICKAKGGKGSPHASAENGSIFSPAKDLGSAGNGGQGTIGDVLLNGNDGTTGTTPSFSSGQGGDGGNGAGPLGGAGGLYANSAQANYGVAGSPYGGGGSGCADYEGSGGATYKIGGDGADGGVIVTILNIGITTQPLTTSTFCAGDAVSVDYTASGTFNSGNTYTLQLSDASGSFSSPTVIGTINSTTSGTISGTIPTATTTGTGYRFRVVASNPALSGADNGTDITIQSTPNAPTASAQDFCGTKTVADLSPNGTGIAWYATSGSTTPLSGSQTLTTQHYFVSKTINGCESQRTDVQVNSNPLPSIQAGTNQSICDGTSVTLSGSGAGTGGTYVWNHGVTDGIAFTPSVGSVTYTVTGTDANGCENTDQVEVTVNAKPTFTTASTDPTACGNTDGEITLSGLSANTSYDVSYNSMSPNSLTSDASGDITITSLGAGTYSDITITATGGCSTIDNTAVTLTDPASPTVSAGTNQSVCENSSVTLTATNPDGATISWNNGVTDGTAFTPSAGTTTYTVTADLAGCIATDQVQVTVNALPSIQAGANQSICDGTSVTLSGSGAGTGGTYVWNHGVTDGTAFTPSVGSVTYTVTGTDANGCENTDQVEVTVNAKPTFTTASTNPTTCGNTDGEITLSGLLANTSYDISYNSMSPNSLTSDASGDITITSLGAGTYADITITATGGCSTTDNTGVTLTDPTGSNVSASGNTVCMGDSAIISASAAMSGGSYSWDNGAGTSETATVAPNTTTTYTVTYTLAGCSTTATATVTVNPLPTIDAGANVSTCPKDSVTLTASGASTYSWDNGLGNGNAKTVAPKVNTTYIAFGTDQNGCTNSDTVMVSIKPHPIAMAGDTLPSICKKGTSIIMNGTIGGSATSGEWIGGAGVWNDATDPQIATYQAGMNDIGWIELKLVASGGSCPNDTAVNYIKIRDCILAVHQEVDNNFKLYPNPSNGVFKITGEHLATDFNKYQIITTTGQVVKAGKIRSNNQEIKAIGIAKGFYLLRLMGKETKMLKIKVK